MIVKRVFHCTLQSENPCEFAENVEENIMSKLKDIYVGKYYKDNYVIKILSIDRYSDIRIAKDNLTAYGRLDVAFSAECFIIEVGEILANVTIVKKDNILVCRYVYDEESSIAVCIEQSSGDDVLPVIDLGMKITAICDKPIVTKSFRNKSIVYAKILTCKRTEYYFRIKGLIPQDILNTFINIHAYLIENILDELKRREELMQTKSTKERLLFLERIYYSYDMSESPKIETITTRVDGNDYLWSGPERQTGTESEGQTTSNIVNLIELLEPLRQTDVVFNTSNLTGVWCRQPYLYGSSPNVVRYTDKATIKELSAPEGNMNDFSIMLREIFNYLTVMREMTEQYSDDDIKSYFKFWKYLQSKKLNM